MKCLRSALSRFIVGARVYREAPTADGDQCNWEVLTTTLQDLKNLISDRIEIDPDRSEKERLLYKRISKDLISYIEVNFQNFFFANLIINYLSINLTIPSIYSLSKERLNTM